MSLGWKPIFADVAPFNSACCLKPPHGFFWSLSMSRCLQAPAKNCRRSWPNRCISARFTQIQALSADFPEKRLWSLGTHSPHFCFGHVKKSSFGGDIAKCLMRAQELAVWFPHILDNWPIINVPWSRVGVKMTHLAGWSSMSSMSSIGIKHSVISLLERFPSWDRWPYTPYAMLWPHQFCGSSRGLWLHHACGEGGGRWHGQRRGSDDPWHPVFCTIHNWSPLGPHLGGQENLFETIRNQIHMA